MNTANGVLNENVTVQAQTVNKTQHDIKSDRKYFRQLFETLLPMHKIQHVPS